MAVGRGIKALSSGILLCGLVAGCSSAGSVPDPAAPTSSGPASSTASAKPASITVAVYGPKGSLGAYDTLASRFAEEHPNVTVRVQDHPDAESVLKAVESGHPPDVFVMDHDHLPRLVQERRVHPVDGLLEARKVNFGDGYQRGGLTAFAANARLQCMPNDVSPLVVYYNKDLVDLRRLARRGEQPPTPLDGWTWDMFATAARRAARGPADGVYIEPSLTTLAPFVWSAGGEIVDDPRTPTTLTLASGASRAALQQVLALVRDPNITPSTTDLDKQDAVSRFVHGRLGMILGTRALTPLLRAAHGLRFDVMPLPTLGPQRTIADMTGYCISSHTRAVPAAGDFLAFAVSDEGATITARSGYVVPSNVRVANSPVFTQESRQPQSSFIFNEGVRRAEDLPFVPAWPEMADEVQPALNRLFYAPVINLDALLGEIDTTSQRVLAPRGQQQ